jgi:hypothetical protein
MFIPLVPLILFAVSWFFFVVAVDPKSKYGVLGVVFLLGALCVVFWPHVAPALAVR